MTAVPGGQECMTTSVTPINLDHLPPPSSGVLTGSALNRQPGIRDIRPPTPVTTCAPVPYQYGLSSTRNASFEVQQPHSACAARCVRALTLSALSLARIPCRVKLPHDGIAKVPQHAHTVCALSRLRNRWESVCNCSATIPQLACGHLRCTGCRSDLWSD